MWLSNLKNYVKCRISTVLRCKWHGSPVSACVKVVVRMLYIRIVSATNTNIPPLGQANHQLIGVDTPVAHHHRHPRPLPRPPNRFHHPRQTAGEIPGQRSPNPQDGHALRLAYPPRTPPRLQCPAMVQYRPFLPVVTWQVPRDEH